MGLFFLTNKVMDVIKTIYWQWRNRGKSIVIDSRKVKEGDLFFCLKGERLNGNAFSDDAIERGALLAVMDDQEYYSRCKHKEKSLLVSDSLQTLQNLAQYHRRHLSLPVIAIAGSNGKTTTKELIRAVLKKKYNVYATEGNLNNHIGVPLTLLSIRPDHEIAVVEIGANHPGEVDFLCQLSDPDYGIITNIGKEHLGEFGSFEKVVESETELYRYLRKRGRKIFLYEDDPILTTYSGDMEKIVYSTTNKHAFCYGEEIVGDCMLTLSVRWKSVANHIPFQQVSTHLFGEYNLPNVLAAVTIGLYFHVSIQDINIAISEYKPANSRSQVIHTLKGNILIADYYNANPTSMEAAVRSFSEKDGMDKVLIIGDMLELGEYAPAEHEHILQLVRKLDRWDKVIVVGKEFGNFQLQYSSFKFFTTAEEAKEWLIHHPLKQKTILLKASRGIMLEKLVEML